MGDAVRRIPRYVGSAGLWSNYNMKGRMENHFQCFSLCKKNQGERVHLNQGRY